MMAGMAPSADRPLAQLLEDVAAATPAPGGGSAAAWTAALAAALVEMSARLTLSRAELAERHPRMTELCERAHELRVVALELGERELTSYAPVLEALRLPREDPQRPVRVDAARSSPHWPPSW
jgi:formiminotetrahydrofolate cyclodeaminase